MSVGASGVVQMIKSESIFLSEDATSKVNEEMLYVGGMVRGRPLTRRGNVQSRKMGEVSWVDSSQQLADCLMKKGALTE